MANLVFWFSSEHFSNCCWAMSFDASLSTRMWLQCETCSLSFSSFPLISFLSCFSNSEKVLKDCTALFFSKRDLWPRHVSFWDLILIISLIQVHIEVWKNTTAQKCFSRIRGAHSLLQDFLKHRYLSLESDDTEWETCLRFLRNSQTLGTLWS